MSEQHRNLSREVQIDGFLNAFRAVRRNPQESVYPLFEASNELAENVVGLDPLTSIVFATGLTQGFLPHEREFTTTNIFLIKSGDGSQTGVDVNAEADSKQQGLKDKFTLLLTDLSLKLAIHGFPHEHLSGIYADGQTLGQDISADGGISREDLEWIIDDKRAQLQILPISESPEFVKETKEWLNGEIRGVLEKTE